MQVLGEEPGGPVEGLVCLVERPEERLEHVRHRGCDVENDVDVHLPCALGEPYGVIEEELVRADLEQDRREAGQVRVNSGGEQWLVRVLTAEIQLAGMAQAGPVKNGSIPSFVIIDAPDRV